ncbi:GNAT family N-acetyltransferase [uncultured Psychroserpens sp.]|uniref:GNAT family N-acetyltransferase n=1 Tax=uncultured Psychroserpens sp. TaxID=255436 RepID=UPI00260B377E|nr:GNAT family N-acetyltransferase [uncultured Psychroserpens sp.]
MSITDITYHRVKTDDELNAILRLQSDNLPKRITVSEQEKEGYVTIHHSFDILKRMNDSCAHIIAKHDGHIVGYALCMTKQFKDEIPILISMFNEIESIIPKRLNYIVMGQVCVSKPYRKQGIFRGLYRFMSNVLKPDFKAIITEVNVKNVRSSKAHQAVGFELLKTYVSNNETWELISLPIS